LPRRDPGLDRQTHESGRRGNAEPRFQQAERIGDRLVTDADDIGHLAQTPAGADEAQQFEFARIERRQRVRRIPLGEPLQRQILGELMLDVNVAGRDAADCIHDLARRRDLAGMAPRARLDGLGRVERLGMHAEDTAMIERRHRTRSRSGICRTNNPSDRR
jgi:hypothetical protein